ncbi:uncharacterized protein (TIGR02302 family) [Loktanella ponticola]|uniref:Uncharacterized protein (TIGR02302 family) n=1 Tax=Yoonia ponticola TaxID=1524255 RepID=A0A7W9F075_9RHOB|nr:DUF4175 domain-containing protein [Yoonia ponticola]MBB5722920.1 uncharacterized protein (TIGR02302 family) [Yoonia ponticola]
MRHLAFPIAATRAGMIAENVTRAFWPFWSVLFVVIAPLMFGWQDLVSRETLLGFGAVAAVALIGALVWGARRFKMPARAAAVARVDAALPGRPIAAIADTQAIGAGDPASEAVWKAHVARMEDRTKQAAFVEPDLRIADRDPFGLRFIALLFFVVALLFGSLLRVGTVIDPNGGSTLVAGPVWEGWVEPPAYTGKPSIYLNDIPAGVLRVPEGAQITIRMYGEVGALTVVEDVSGTVADPEVKPETQQTFIAAKDGTLVIEGDNGIAWNLLVVADLPPLVELTGPVEADAMGEMSQPFLGLDDYGVVSGTATIALDLDAVDRRYGLAAAPDAIEPLVLDLPMPFTGDRTDFEEFLVDDLSEHPLANLPVTMQLEVVDASGQVANSPAEPMILPGRRFFQPFAKAIIEQRRDLMWSRSNVSRIADVMKAISHRPEGLFANETTYLRMRAIIRRLDGFVDDGITDEGQAEIVTALWDLAVQLEDGTLADARERMRRAQERLSEAMRSGASEAEIAELMQELREATDDYMRLLAEEQGPQEGDGTDQADSGEESREVSQSEIDAMMDRIQELMEEGRMAEAAQLMEELNQLLENLQFTENGQGGDGPPSPGQQAMEDLEDTLREQEDLSDDAFRELQERSNPERQQDQNGEQQGQQGQEPGQQQDQGQQGGEPGGQQQGQQGQSENQQGEDGQQGEGQGVGEDSQGGGQDDQGTGGEGSGAEDGRSLSERQQALRDELQRQRGGLPDLEGEEGEIAGNALDRAERAMEGAEQALGDGNLAEAIDRQAEALDALRNGMRALNRALAENQSQEPGEGEQNGGAIPRSEQSQRDPLGRQLGSEGGQFGTDEGMLQEGDVYRRAEELLDELRRRSADQERPEIERDYLRRLLDRF